MMHIFPPWHRLLHQLWTKAVGQPGYDKALWMELEAEIERMQRLLEDRT